MEYYEPYIKQPDNLNKIKSLKSQTTKIIQEEIDN